jgi:pyrimidine oxygenase
VTCDRKLMFGVFLPLANGGWIISENTPRIDGCYALNRQAAILSDRLGFDFILSMMKWRGYGGKTDHWGVSLESMTMMAALAEVTSRTKVWCTAHTLLHHPVVIAKIMSTLDHISQGRAGLNIVSGAFRGEFEQMGAWRSELDHDRRYDLAREWIEIILRLWRDKRVDYHGEFYDITDCVSDPKPVSKPRPDLICAGMSDVGLDFTAKYTDGGFVAGQTEEEIAVVSKRAKDFGAKYGKAIMTFAMYTVVPGITDKEAEARVEHFIAGTDHEAVEGMRASYGLKPDGRETSLVARSRRNGFMTSYLAGGAETIQQKIVHTIETAELDGMMLIFPDYTDDLRFFGENILPAVRRSLGQAMAVDVVAEELAKRSADLRWPVGASGRGRQ